MKLILLPGLDGSGELFQDLLGALGPDIDFEVWPLPTDGEQTPVVLANRLHSRLEMESAGVLLLAESYSGRIAFELSRLSPGKVRGLILVASFLGRPRKVLRLLSLFPLRLFPWNTPPRWALRLFCLGWNSPPKLLSRVQEAIKEIPSLLLAERVVQVLRLAPPTDRSEVRCLYLQAQSDRLIPRRQFREVQKWLPNSEIEVVSGPHFLLQAKPQECCSKILPFRELLLGPAS